MVLIDLQEGVVPISKAASALAALIKKAGKARIPIVITQKGYPTGVLLPVDLFVELRALAEQAQQANPEAVGQLLAQLNSVGAPVPAGPPTSARPDAPPARQWLTTEELYERVNAQGE